MSSHGSHNGHGEGKAPRWLAHHFVNAGHQYQSDKLGMWLFLVTEILFFSGLFCAYAVYRRNHPEVFVYASQFLDVNLGGLNTVILLCSSLTMALAVRCAQLSQRIGLVICLLLTILCAFGFLGIKAVEYHAKWKHGLLWGKYYTHVEGAEHSAEDAHAPAMLDANEENETSDEPVPVNEIPEAAAADGPSVEQSGAVEETAPLPEDASEAGKGLKIDKTLIPPAGVAPGGLAKSVTLTDESGGHEIKVVPRNVRLFFGVYFAMTGLHGLHVIIGIIIIGVIAWRAWHGHYSAEYFTPVDLVGLYWHLVDLIWIFLFPLLYLIH